ncbi:MAG: pantoate--beta-alanine ligase [Peptococcales bacterium]|jgi:pantoate--beta-alanine ligase
MELLKTIAQMRDWIANQKKAGHTIGLVPTMGYLHEGHLSLARQARENNNAVVMSIFVNPLQFGPREDFATYPRDLEADCRLAERTGIDVVFYPDPEEIYPQYPPFTVVDVKGVTEVLCGASRPGHFTGVATVVTKLFNIIQPDRAYFGQKDYQQVQVIKRIVADLNIPVQIETVPIKREADGLAMSSRNNYLSPGERQEALCLYQALQICRHMYENGENKVSAILEAMRTRILQEPSAVIDYIEICDAQTLAPMTEIKGSVVVALAVRIGKTRLIDNLLLEVR